MVHPLLTYNTLVSGLVDALFWVMTREKDWLCVAAEGDAEGTNPCGKAAKLCEQQLRKKPAVERGEHGFRAGAEKGEAEPPARLAAQSRTKNRLRAQQAHSKLTRQVRAQLFLPFITPVCQITLYSKRKYVYQEE